ncbi:MAG: type II CAAX prenyl endopeptidase Rce1 family protein [Alistipes sp.]
MTLMILATMLYRRLRGGTHRIARFSLRGFNPAILLWGLVMMLAASIVIDPLLALLPAPPDATGRGLWALVTVVVLAPVLEELPAGASCSNPCGPGGVITALWASSLFFAVMHLHVTLAVNALVLGLILGFIFCAPTRSMRPSCCTGSTSRSP